MNVTIGRIMGDYFGEDVMASRETLRSGTRHFVAEPLESRRLLASTTVAWAWFRESPNPQPGTVPGVTVSFADTGDISASTPWSEEGIEYLADNTGHRYNEVSATVAGLPEHTMVRVIVGGSSSDDVLVDVAGRDSTLEYWDWWADPEASTLGNWLVHDDDSVTVTFTNQNAGAATVYWLQVEVYNPTVTVGASHASISEDAGAPAEFVVSRDMPAYNPWGGTPMNEPVPDTEVLLSVGGTATRGVDYTLDIPAIAVPESHPKTTLTGTANKMFSLTPIMDDVGPETGESVCLSAVDGSGYGLAAQHTAAVTLSNVKPQLSVDKPDLGVVQRPPAGQQVDKKVKATVMNMSSGRRMSDVAMNVVNLSSPPGAAPNAQIGLVVNGPFKTDENGQWEFEISVNDITAIGTHMVKVLLDKHKDVWVTVQIDVQ
jgi:hypothetical protein